MAEASPAYPVSFSVDYPDRNLNRLTTFFRIFTIIPIGVVIALLAGGGTGSGYDASGVSYQYAAGGIVVLPLILMILFRQKYPRWWFDWNLQLLRFGARVEAYLWLLTDVYPSTDEEQSVHLDIPYPDVKQDLKRWMPLVKWFLAIPHYIVLVFLSIAVIVLAIISWFVILFTGRYPRGIFDFIVGVMRWGMRVVAYAFVLTTDRYPVFSLE
jgi:membrane protease YdiL (CAAX protease family)